jgi:hypothetical protein
MDRLLVAERLDSFNAAGVKIGCGAFAQDSKERREVPQVLDISLLRP